MAIAASCNKQVLVEVQMHGCQSFVNVMIRHFGGRAEGGRPQSHV